MFIHVPSISKRFPSISTGPRHDEVHVDAACEALEPQAAVEELLDVHSARAVGVEEAEKPDAVVGLEASLALFPAIQGCNLLQ